MLTLEYINRAIAARESSLPPRGQSHPAIRAQMLPRFEKYFAQSAETFELLKSTLLKELDLPATALEECADWEAVRRIWPELSPTLLPGELSATNLEAVNNCMLSAYWQIYSHGGTISRGIIEGEISNAPKWARINELLAEPAPYDPTDGRGGADWQRFVFGSYVIDDAVYALELIKRYFIANPDRQRVIVLPNMSLGLVYPPFAYLSKQFRERQSIVLPDNSKVLSGGMEEQKVIIAYTHVPSREGTRKQSGAMKFTELIWHENTDVISTDRSLASIAGGQRSLTSGWWCPMCDVYDGRADAPRSHGDDVMASFYRLTPDGKMTTGPLDPPDFTGGIKERSRLFLVNTRRGDHPSEIDNNYHLVYEELGVPLLLDGGRQLENSARLFMCVLAQRVEEEYAKVRG